MKLDVFSIYDQKAKAYLPPFFLPNKLMAQRTFSDCVNSPNHQFGAHPEDYTLFRLGHFDDETAKFDNFNAPELISTGLALVLDDEDSPDETTVSDAAPVLKSAESGNSA